MSNNNIISLTYRTSCNVAKSEVFQSSDVYNWNCCIFTFHFMAIEVNINFVSGSLSGSEGHFIVASIYLQSIRMEGAATLCHINCSISPATPCCIHYECERFARAGWGAIVQLQYLKAKKYTSSLCILSHYYSYNLYYLSCIHPNKESLGSRF